MMPSSKHDPYQELEAYLRQAQAEVGRAVEDLLASESTGSSSSSAGSRKNSCPDLYSYAEADDPYRTPRKFVPTYTSLSAPRPRRDASGGKVQRAADVVGLVTAATTNGSSKRCSGDGEPPCVWDSYYGWESLHLSRPPSGDAHLLSVYTERLLEAVNGSFIDELSAADAAEDDDERGSPTGSRTTAEPVPLSSGVPGDDVCDGGKNSESDESAVSLLLEQGGDLDSVDGVGESAGKLPSPPVRSSSWPDLAALRRGSALGRVCTRSGSYPQTTAARAKGGAGAACLGDEQDEDQTVSYDGSLYKNQQLYYESEGSCDDGPEETAGGAVNDTKPVSADRFTEVELRISDSDHDENERRTGCEVNALPELFIREDERDHPSASLAQRSATSFDYAPAATAAAALVAASSSPAAAAPTTAAVRDSFTLDLRSPGLVRSRLNPYTIEVIASHVSSPDEVLATVSTLEARLASRPLPPLVIDEAEPDTGTWSSTSTAHSASTVSRHELEEFLKGVEPPHDPPSWPQDAVTQTTPEISRSSSFTWVADYGEDLGSSKESLVNVAGNVETAQRLAAAVQSPSPVSNSSSSSCDAPPTPLTPRASPSSQEVSSDLSDSAAHGASTRTPRSLLHNGASPSLPTLDGREEGAAHPSTQRQLSLEEKSQVRSLSRPAAKAAAKKAPEVVTSPHWTSPQQLSHKASSAPVLLKNRPPTSLGDAGQKGSSLRETGPASAGSTPEEEVKAFHQARSQSAKDIKEVEAVHACEWLRQAGFPQYVQMYEDNNFPVEITTVLRDHPSLDPDELQSLFRRLNTLNKSARLKSDGLVKQSMHQDSDEEEGPALSYNWQFHRSSRRWSRVSPPLPVVVTPTGSSSRTPQHLAQQQQQQPLPAAAEAYSSHDSVFLDEPRSSPESRLSTSDERLVGTAADLEGSPGPKLRRSGSERIRDAILRRMDSLRGNRRRRKRGAPQGSCAGGDPAAGGGPWSNHLGPENHALSDSECSPQLGHRRKAGSFRSRHKNQQQQPASRWLSASSEHGRVSVYDNVPAGVGGSGDPPGSQGVSAQQQQQQPQQEQTAVDAGSVGSGSTGRGGPEEVDKPTCYTAERRDSGVGSSLTRAGNGSPCSGQQGGVWHCFSSSPEQLTCLTALRYEHLSASQLLVLKKLALLHLTALMERFSPPYRSGWGWAVPKFIKRMRAPDYKDKTVFGVPLSVSLQRTGHALPPSIQGAMEFLRKSAPEATGLFRKSGVRSRIQKLRSLHESATGPISYEQHQAYDVADLLKQYFRELPDGLLTGKLSDTFLCIFQHIPEELRLDALQAAVLLIPDENREVLETLLVFLDDVCRHAQENQMTVANIAVCIAPSLFQLAVPRSASASPRRRATTVGIPDQRELNENRAAHECLARMIIDHKKLFQISLETLQQCRLEQYEPMTLDELGSLKCYLEGCLHTLITEAREKSKGWANVQHADVDLAFKKPGDGLPLRLWRCVVEVEAPPVELLTRILRERHVWDNTLLKWRHIARLDKQSEVIQYICGSMKPHAPRDFCVLRAWRTELTRGSCALVELSVNHPDATVLLRGVRAVVLGSRYLIEPCGAGKSRVTHISRIDFRGRTPDWYNKVYGHLCALLLVRLRDSFVQRAEGPETKV